jgi:hypothetical protein
VAQYKIPQNVGLEDKIVGPLTLRQLIMLAVGFGISYVLFAILSKLYELNFIEYGVIALPGLLAVAFALIKINDIPLLKYLFLFLEFSIKPKKRVWDHRGISSIVAPDLDEDDKTVTPTFATELDEKAKKAANLKELTRMLDSGEFQNVKDVQHEDIDVSNDDDLVTQAYFGDKKKIDESPTKNMYWRTKKSQLKRLEMLASLPTTELKKGTKEADIAKEQIRQAKAEAESENQKPVQVSAPVIKQKPVQISAPAVTQKPAPQTKQEKPSILGQQKTNTVKPVNVVASPKNQTMVKQNAPVVKKTEIPKQQAPVQNQNSPRKRQRQIPQPVRKDNHINTTNKNQPAQYLPKESPKPSNGGKPKSAQPKPEKPKDGKIGEFDFKELQKGEIEINLD